MLDALTWHEPRQAYVHRATRPFVLSNWGTGQVGIRHITAFRSPLYECTAHGNSHGGGADGAGDTGKAELLHSTEPTTTLPLGTAHVTLPLTDRTAALRDKCMLRSCAPCGRSRPVRYLVHAPRDLSATVGVVVQPNNKDSDDVCRVPEVG